MKTKFCFLDPGAIVGVVVAVIILAVSTFAFFTVISNVPNSGSTYDQGTAYALNNTSATGMQVINIIGIVLIIGAIMSIVGLVYNYIR